MTSSRKVSTTAVDGALARSLLAEFPPALREALLQDAVRVDFPAGTTAYHEADEPRCYLVITGLIRVYMIAPDGRQITVRYARTGELLGIAAIVGGPAPVSVQILTDAALLMLNVKMLQRGGQNQPRVGWLMAQEVALRLFETNGNWIQNGPRFSKGWERGKSSPPWPRISQDSRRF